MDLRKKVVRIKVQYQRPDGSWKTGKWSDGSRATFQEDDAILADIYYEVLLRNQAARTVFYRYADENTEIRIVQTTVYQDYTDGYAGREIHTNEVISGPLSAAQHKEMRIYR